MTGHGCIVCDEPGRFDLRLLTLEENYEELKTIFREHKKVTFEKMEDAQTETAKKFDKVNSYLIATLTTAVISALLLAANLIVIYGGR